MAPRLRATCLALCLALAACSAPSDPARDAATRDASGSDDIGPPRDAPADDAAIADDAPVLDAARDDVASTDTPPPPDAPPPPDVAVTDASTPPAGDLSMPGPLAATTTRASVALPATTGCTGAQCNVTVDATVPTPTAERPGPFPLAIVSNGFQLDAAQYASYAARLASWGYVVLRWNTTGETPFSAMTHDALANAVVALIDWAAAQGALATGPLAGRVSTARVFLAGHSRGGKVSVLAATRDARVAGAFGIDPVDAPPPGMSVSAAFPSAVAALGSSARAVPLAVVGAALGAMPGLGGMACAPATDNYARFYDAARGPAFEATVARAGHMQFLDSRATCGFTCGVCVAGAAADGDVRALTQVLLVAWAERTVRGLDTSRFTTGAWIAGPIASGAVTTRAR